MGTVLLDMSMALDGFATGPDGPGAQVTARTVARGPGSLPRQRHRRRGDVQ
jgi:hypothetical protein